MTFQEKILTENTSQDWLVFGAILMGGVAGFYVFERWLLGRVKALSKKTKTELDDLAIEAIHLVKLPYYFLLAFYLAIQALKLPGLVGRGVGYVALGWTVVLIIRALGLAIDFGIKKQLQKEADPGSEAAFQVLGKIVRGVLWALGVLFVLSNFGINVSSMLAGLGIGGVAIAFALQNILGDLFSSFAIFFDKPFVVGDFIIVGEDMGVVEKVGIKTTRLRSIEGEEIVISNQELTSARVHNYKKMEKRRVSFNLGVTYDTPTKKVKQIPELVKKIIKEIKDTEFDRAHFKSFKDSALLFAVVYYIPTADYNRYMDIQQEINLKIKQVFEAEKIEFAYPSQTIYLEKN